MKRELAVGLLLAVVLVSGTADRATAQSIVAGNLSGIVTGERDAPLGRVHITLTEAGTGVGKSFAYLIPAALWALQNGLRVIVSTNTINLQDQLINKDIPDLQAALDLDLRATILKGRNNYLCPRRMEAMRRRGPETPNEMRVFAKILVWLQGSGTGDRGPTRSTKRG